MKQLQVFDPPMCCSSGVCGPDVDPALPKFAADLTWIQSQGVVVERFNLAQQPQAFAASELVRRELTEHGNGCLPLIFVDGVAFSRGVYPSREQLATMVGLPATSSAGLPVLASGCCGTSSAGSGTTKGCC